VSADFSSFNIKRAAFICNHGGIISYPTESVFGLGCNPHDLAAAYKLLDLKRRPIEKGLILIAAHIEQLQPYILVPAETLRKADEKQTQPTTWLVKPSARTPYWITGQHKKLAVRITQHPITKQLCERLDYPLISTSANPGGKHPARSSLKSRIYFGDGVDYYVSGRTGALKNPTQIIDFETNEVIRKS